MAKQRKYAGVVTMLLSTLYKSWAHISQVFITQLRGSEFLRLLLALALDMVVCVNIQRRSSSRL